MAFQAKSLIFPTIIGLCMKKLSQNIIPGACAGVRDVSALGVEAACGSVLGCGSNRGFGPDAVNDGRR